ncbi:MAG: glycosyltransferase family A protein [Myxococcota bacterium]
MPRSFVVITPTRDEERTIEATIRSMLAQSARPLRWVIVNDGSTDRSAEIVEKHLPDNPWIELVTRPDRGHRALGGGVVEAFNVGLARVRELDWDYLVKLDADLEFGASYFANLLRRFAANPRLGMASGKTFLIRNGVKSIEYCHDEHVRGPAKMYTREVFEAIGGLEAVRGWDMIDETKAQMLGFETRSFVEEEILHLRPIDARQANVVRSRYEMGKLYWFLGYHWAYHFVRCLRSALQDFPLGIGGAALFAGYLVAALGRSPRYDAAYVAFVQRKQLARIRVAHLASFFRESRARGART